MKQARREREERVGKMQLEREKERQVNGLLLCLRTVTQFFSSNDSLILILTL